jgi:hypothetical protein
MHESAPVINPANTQKRSGLLHELKLFFSLAYRNGCELEELLESFEVSSPPFTRPIFYKHTKLKVPENVLFEVSTKGLLRYSTLNLEPAVFLTSFLHLDAGQHVYHLDLFNGQISRSPAANERSSAEKLLELTEILPREIKWLHTLESSPTSKVIGRGSFHGGNASSFRDVIRLWQLMRIQNPNEPSLIARPCARWSKDLP